MLFSAVLVFNQNAGINISKKHFHVPVLKFKEVNPVVEIEINVLDSLKDYIVKEIIFDTRGTTDLKDIESANLYHYDSSQNISKPVIPGNAVKFGKQVKPSSKLSFKGSFTLKRGNNYFCLAIKLTDKANIMNLIRASCSRIITNRGAADLDVDTGNNIQRIGIALRKHNDDNVHTFRIPCLAKSNNGTLLASYEVRRKRWDDLQGDIDIGLSRSTDGGNNWGKMKIVFDMGKYGGLPEKYNGVSDPCLLIDKNSKNIFLTGLWMHGLLDDKGKWIDGLTDTSKVWNHQWLKRGSQPGFDIKETCQFFVYHSSDDGKTWSVPQNITQMCKQKNWWLWSPTSGTGITLKDGTLVYPTQGRDSVGETFSNITYSKDGGKTWVTSSPAYSNTTECSVVELDSGLLMLNMRDNRNSKNETSSNGRAIVTTSDMGKTWIEHKTSHKTLNEPVCMASLYKHEFTENGVNKSVLLFSNPNTKKDRHHMTIKASFDNGNTWPEKYWIMLDERTGRGYSSLTGIDENTIGILYEGSQADLVFQKINLSEILKNKK